MKIDEYEEELAGIQTPVEKNPNAIIIQDLIGKTINFIEGLETGSDYFTLHCIDRANISFYHEQDCCESVSIDQIDGNIEDLLHSPILMAEEVAESGDGGRDDSYTWTFYKFATAKGYVTIKWYGSSNGYYSESVYYKWNYQR